VPGEYVLTVSELASAARMHPKTIYRLIRTAQLPAQRVGKSYRILASDAENLLGYRPQITEPQKKAS
jgi:excisionase family DNA binding protein